MDIKLNLSYYASIVLDAQNYAGIIGLGLAWIGPQVLISLQHLYTQATKWGQYAKFYASSDYKFWWQLTLHARLVPVVFFKLSIIYAL